MKLESIVCKKYLDLLNRNNIFNFITIVDFTQSCIKNTEDNGMSLTQYLQNFFRNAAIHPFKAFLMLEIPPFIQKMFLISDRFNQEKCHLSTITADRIMKIWDPFFQQINNHLEAVLIDDLRRDCY